MNTTPNHSNRFQLATQGMRQGIQAMWRGFFPAANKLPQEQGDRLASDVAMERHYRRLMWVDTERRAMIQTVREMDAQDGRVKRIHNRIARDAIRGGLLLTTRDGSDQFIKKEWMAFVGRLQLDMAEKLKSDARGMLMEGNLPLQLVLDPARREIVAGIRMPSDTIVPITDMGGRFKTPTAAFEQRDVMTGRVLASFAAWQLALGRLDPDNYDDLGSMGRPLLDSVAVTWRKLVMTEEDLVIRRRMRAPLRLAHVLEGADGPEIDKYRENVENEKGEITTDFYLNRKGGVTAIQGDAKLNEIEDVVHLMDTFFSGTPAPKALFGYTNGLSRDILEDIKRDYYDEIDGFQDTVASVYLLAFRIHLLFKGVDPASDAFTLRFAQRRTDTPNQVADLALKYQALGVPDDMIYTTMGMDPVYVKDRQEEQRRERDPYPNPDNMGRPANTNPARRPANVNVTPGNAPKGESATSISTPGSNGGRGRA